MSAISIASMNALSGSSLGACAVRLAGSWRRRYQRGTLLRQPADRQLVTASVTTNRLEQLGRGGHHWAPQQLKASPSHTKPRVGPDTAVTPRTGTPEVAPVMPSDRGQFTPS
jgi:hypothetical protein